MQGQLRETPWAAQDSKVAVLLYIPCQKGCFSFYAPSLLVCPCRKQQLFVMQGRWLFRARWIKQVNATCAPTNKWCAFPMPAQIQPHQTITKALLWPSCTLPLQLLLYFHSRTSQESVIQDQLFLTSLTGKSSSLKTTFLVVVTYGFTTIDEIYYYR
jgi:hypothetical protein